ncbi:DUF1254 domain-containing protein [Lysobacter soli]|uniref:DUF1254 domain-containing protein n=1 Tax=Lysobacter soli TaxID=453783 RepID=A0A3D8VEC0_9GAMM|nr:DUF1254 domain-containing protein [Lysobacter soli]RDY67757.1 DUF1254 domain-containing protein [Lysobacter soli]
MRIHTLALAIVAATSLAACQKQPSPDAATPAPQPTAATAPAPAATPTPAPAVPGPVAGTRLTEPYVRMAARDTYFWAWPMVNIYNRRLGFKDLPGPGKLGGVLPAAPPNSLMMLTDYVAPSEREVACPNQDVVYGGGPLALDIEPVVIQVPDFGDRFWVYQVVDSRTDSFVKLGKMYDTRPGFYLLAGPDWKGDVPQGITEVFRAGTNTGYVIPRVALLDTAEDRAAVQPLVAQIDMYPLSKFDGKLKQHDWSKNPTFPQPPRAPGGGEAPKVNPDTFFDELPVVLKDAKPLPGEETRYAQALALVDALQKDPALKAAAIDEAKKAEQELIAPLLQFRNFGVPLPHNWTTVRNGAQFGSDYFTRTAVAKSNIYVNKPNEATYFYQDLDDSGARLNGSKRYTVTFDKGGPPVKGFWSLTLYDADHFFAPNEINRYSVGTKNKDLKPNPDGTLTIYVQPDAPSDPVQRANWLPSPKGADFSLYVRTYWPEQAILDGQWSPPAVKPVSS